MPLNMRNPKRRYPGDVLEVEKRYQEMRLMNLPRNFMWSVRIMAGHDKHYHEIRQHFADMPKYRIGFKKRILFYQEEIVNGVLRIGENANFTPSNYCCSGPVGELP